MSRIVAVSNRVADVGKGATAGGLAIGVHGALEGVGGVWFGWSGELTDGEPGRPEVRVRRGVTYATIALNGKRFERYYNGFCNNALWPLFHYRQGCLEYRRADFDDYLAINEDFARGLKPVLEPGDTVWVHDFHLIPLGARLREQGQAQPIGFFLHTPLPSFEMLRALPVYRELLALMCAYDVVGFQTERDRRAFVNAVTQPEIGGIALRNGLVCRGDSVVRTGVFPVGVDLKACAKLASDNLASGKLERIRSSLSGRRLLIGADRLDYSKGLPKRFRAYESLLERYTEHRGGVVFMQIAPRTRSGVLAYTDIRHELERAAGHINGKYAEIDWVPLRYLNRVVDRGTLMAMFRLARIGIVTPIRDGMNLVAKEYLAAQDPDDPGVLVLSTMAGAAEELAAAILVNPHDVDAVADGIHRGLCMPIEERRERHRALLRALRRNDIDAWRTRFIETLVAATQPRTRRASVLRKRRQRPVTPAPGSRVSAAPRPSTR
jgi:trehalose 6-phosphate synthase